MLVGEGGQVVVNPVLVSNHHPFVTHRLVVVFRRLPCCHLLPFVSNNMSLQGGRAGLQQIYSNRIPSGECKSEPLSQRQDRNG